MSFEYRSTYLGAQHRVGDLLIADEVRSILRFFTSFHLKFLEELAFPEVPPRPWPNGSIPSQR